MVGQAECGIVGSCSDVEVEARQAAYVIKKSVAVGEGHGRQE